MKVQFIYYILILLFILLNTLFISNKIDRQTELLTKIIPVQMKQASKVIHQAQEERVYNSRIKEYLNQFTKCNN